MFPVNYVNGNYKVRILKDGTKIRYTEDDYFESVRPETIDLNISNYCENNCPYCYIDASINGKHGDLEMESLMNIAPYTEIAINYAKHPGLMKFLETMKAKKVIVNMTINEIDFRKDHVLIFLLQYNNLVHGIGISVSNFNAGLEIILKKFKNIVFHTIAGITPINTFEKLKGKKVLILGYKTKGRGINVVPDINKLKYKLEEMKYWFDILSFDNLALEQLDVKSIVSDKMWNDCYMGEDGKFSMYIDTVGKKFYKSSLEEVGWDIENKSVEEMFKIIKRNNKNVN